MTVGQRVRPDIKASDSAQEQADWLELHALASADGNASISDLERVLRRSGTVESIVSVETGADVDRLGDTSEALAEAAFFEIESRRRACPTGYPFTIAKNSIQLSQEPSSSTYVFQLLLSWHGHENGPSGVRGDRLFEEMCYEATRTALVPDLMTGGSYLFAAPRRAIWKKSFKDAVTSMTQYLGEGQGPRHDRPKISDMKDGGLDIAIWQSFPDDRPGRVIFFGQCATGKQWRTKFKDLIPQMWCEEWLTDIPPVSPTRLFYVPHRIGQDEWAGHSRLAGLLLDRCRISHCMPVPAEHLSRRLARWVDFHVVDAPQVLSE